MVSSAAFSAASGVYAWAAPIGAALGLAVNIDEFQNKNLQKRFEDAIDKALAKTKKATNSESKARLIEELENMEIDLDSLNQIIKKTEIYRMRYCTDLDAKEIIERFDIFFREEISRDEMLSNLYILSTGLTSLEKLQEINKIMHSNGDRLERIENEVTKISKILRKVDKFLTTLFNEIAFILVGMAVFLGFEFFNYPYFDRDFIFIVPLCYGITDLITWYLTKNKISLKGIKYSRFIEDRSISFLLYFLVQMLMTVSCFWLILFATDIGYDINILKPTMGVVLGRFISTLLYCLTNNNSVHDKYVMM